jgi:hypothetical protein
MVRITVLPSEWPLPRALRFEERGENKRELVLDPPVPPRSEDEFIAKGNGDWHIVLRWSREAIAAAAYEMTFWYMEKVGEAIYDVDGYRHHAVAWQDVTRVFWRKWRVRASFLCRKPGCNANRPSPWVAPSPCVILRRAIARNPNWSRPDLRPVASGVRSPRLQKM